MTTAQTLAARTIRFGEFEISTDRFELCRQGKQVQIEPQALEVLTYLASHAGRLISKEELWQTLWQGRCVSDAAVAKQVREARRALGDDRRNPTWIKTVYARGAIFVGRIEAPPQPPSRPPAVATHAGAKATEISGSEARLSPLLAPPPPSRNADVAMPRRTEKIRAAKARVAAYDLMLRGKHHLRVGTEDSCRLAFEFFSKSAQLNPESAQAQTGVAISSAHLWIYYAIDRHQLARGQAALGKALGQHPNQAETRHASGLYEWIRGDRLRAASTFESVLTTDTSMTECVVDFSRLCRLLDDPDRALRLLSSDAWRRNADYRVPLFTAMGYKYCDDAARAEEFHEKGVCAARQHLEVFPQDARAWSLGGAALAHLGNHRQALGWTRTATQLARTDGMVMYNASCIAATSGDRESALSTLRTLRDQRFPFRSWIEIDRDLDPLREDARFGHILASWPQPDRMPTTSVPSRHSFPTRPKPIQRG